MCLCLTKLWVNEWTILGMFRIIVSFTMSLTINCISDARESPVAAFTLKRIKNNEDKVNLKINTGGRKGIC